MEVQPSLVLHHPQQTHNWNEGSFRNSRGLLTLPHAWGQSSPGSHLTWTQDGDPWIQAKCHTSPAAMHERGDDESTAPKSSTDSTSLRSVSRTFFKSELQAWCEGCLPSLAGSHATRPLEPDLARAFLQACMSGSGISSILNKHWPISFPAEALLEMFLHSYHE